MEKKILFALVILTLFATFFVFNNCTISSTNVGNKTYTDMSSTEKATWMLSFYNSQYADYMIKNGYTRLDTNSEWVKTREVNLSEEEKEFLRKKKKILQEVYPLISLFSEQSQFGGTPSRETEEKILQLLNSF